MPRLTFRNVLDPDNHAVIIPVPAGAWQATGRVPISNNSGVIETWFRADFSDPDAAGTSQYNFGYFYGTSASGTAGVWTFDHLATGNYDGGPCAQLTRAVDSDQYTMGWAVTTSAMSHTFEMGDAFYLRFRLRLDPSWRFESPGGWPANGQNKFLMMGNTGTTPNSRVIVMLQRGPQGNFQCMLGSDPHNPGAWVTPSDFGLSGADWNDAALVNLYGSLSVHVNIGIECVGPMCITYAGNPNTPQPSANSAVPTDGWHHVQIYVQSGDGTATFTIWDNNNTYGTPSQTITNLPLGVDGWQNGFTIGGQTTGPLTPAAIYRIGAAEIGPTFDASWYPGA